MFNLLSDVCPAFFRVSSGSCGCGWVHMFLVLYLDFAMTWCLMIAFFRMNFETVLLTCSIAGYHVCALFSYAISYGYSSSQVPTFSYAFRGNLEASAEPLEGESSFPSSEKDLKIVNALGTYVGTPSHCFDQGHMSSWSCQSFCGCLVVKNDFQFAVSNFL